MICNPTTCTGAGLVTVKDNNNNVWFNSIAYKHFSSYVEIDSQQSYTLHFYLNNSTDNKPIYTLTNWIPGGGQVHTLVLNGIVGAVGKQAIDVNQFVDASFEYSWIRLAAINNIFEYNNYIYIYMLF